MAQYENVWAFGSYAGIDFNGGTAKAIKTSIMTNEGTASICNARGQLLFYTDGTDVYNRNHQLMPNGNNLPGKALNFTRSSSQAALIVPVPGDKDAGTGTAGKYYVFTLTHLEGQGGDLRELGKLYYSIVDLSLNNGLGDVMPGHKGIVLDSFLTEHMVAVSGNDCSIWLLVVSRSNYSFKAYTINENGIGVNPVVSPAFRGLGDVYLGYINIAPDGSKLAITQGSLVVYDFDMNTGVVSRPFVLDAGPYYGVSFSPDNTKLYSTTYAYGGTSQIYQFNLSGNDTDAVIASKTLLGPLTTDAGIKRGPDGKIYVAGSSGGNALRIIHQPDLAGQSCQYDTIGLPLITGTRHVWGLPNSVVLISSKRVNRFKADTAICTRNHLLKAIDTSGINYMWNDSTTGAVRQVDNPGTYWVSYQVKTPCKLYEYIDTLQVVFDFSRTNRYTTTRDSGMCKSDTVLLTAVNRYGSAYTWEDGSRGMERKVNQAGTYTLSYQVDSLCEDYVDSFIIVYPEKKFEIAFTGDTVICQDAPAIFYNTSDPRYREFNWSFGDGQFSSQENPVHVYRQPGNYQVLLNGRINDRCQDTASIFITVDSLQTFDFLTDRDSICAGEAIVFTHQANGPTIDYLHWQWGDGSEQAALHQYRLPHAYDHAGIMPVTFSVYFRACRESSFTHPVYVFDLPEVFLGSETGLCLQGMPIILRNLRPAATGYRYLWSNGSVAETLKASHHGIYSLTVSKEPLGCITTESVAISKDCYLDIPNSFTPNGDGVNDYFLPRSLHPGMMLQFRMEVFNRWGQLIFTTNQLEGRGWDGRFNTKEQPEGVYIYAINITMKDNRAERYEGNVTLIR